MRKYAYLCLFMHICISMRLLVLGCIRLCLLTFTYAWLYSLTFFCACLLHFTL